MPYKEKRMVNGSGWHEPARNEEEEATLRSQGFNEVVEEAVTEESPEDDAV